MPFGYIFELMLKRYIFLFSFLLGAVTIANGQSNSILIKGKVVGINGNSDLLTLFVVNKKNQQGNFGNPNGSFEIRVDKEDTVMIGSIGYFTKEICFADSSYRPIYTIDVFLEPLAYYLQQVVVLAPRDLTRIYADIEKLGYNEKDDRLSGFVDPISSPITALYENYSRKAQKERLAKELMNQSKVRDLLKELFREYVSYDIIQLDDDQFDDFINYINVDDEFLKRTSQYDFIVYVKRRYYYYMKQNKYE